MACRNNLLEQEIGSIKQTFVLSVAILEGRHYAWPNMDSVVMVQTLGKKETTKVVRNSDCPYYNEYFTFEKKTTLEKIMDDDITITVIQPRTVFRNRKILGYIKLDIATVWAEPDHQFYRKWAILSAPLDKFVQGTRGFLKVNLVLITKKITPIIPTNLNDDDIEANLLLPQSKIPGRYKANYEFSIHTVEHVYHKMNKEDVQVEVSFAGQKAKSSPKKNMGFTEINERIILRDLFPPLCQRFHINVYIGSSLYTSDYLHLRYVMTDQEDSHLPSFGPAFFHFYENKNMEEYQGCILLSLRTKLVVQSMDEKNIARTIPISALPKEFRPKIRMMLFAMIFECSALDKRFDGEIQFKTVIGHENMGMRFGMDISPSHNISGKINVEKVNRNSSYMVIREKKPLIAFALTLTDYRKRLHGLNMLNRIAIDMGKRLDDIGALFAQEEISLHEEISQKITLCLDTLRLSTKKYLDIASTYNMSTLSELVQAKFKDKLQTMQNIYEKAGEIFNQFALRRTFLKARKLYDQIVCLLEFINDTWPDVLITASKGDEKIAYIRIHPKDVLYSAIEEERGVICGEKTTLFLQGEKKKRPRAVDVTNMVGKIEALIWLGTEKYGNEFLKKHVPLGFEEISEGANSIYRYVSTKEIHVFQCRCHLFQGRINPGFDSTALCDAMVRIHINDDCQESTIEQKTLNPVWNQTLIFKKTHLYGDISFIKNHAPSFIIELLDRDKYFFWENVGKTSIRPIIKSKQEPYAPPRFPPKLQWVKVFNDEGVSAEILGAFEMLEISGEVIEEEDQAEKDVNRIPDDIRPELANFRMEILFWGVRDLKRTKLKSINNPRITIDCVKTTVNSESLKDAKKFINFESPIKTVELILPTDIEYASPIIIMMSDKQKLGDSYVGTYIKHLKYFVAHPIEEAERKELLEGKLRFETEAEDLGPIESDILTKKPLRKHKIAFAPQNCFCRTSQMKKLVDKTVQVRCVCTRTIWMKFRQFFNRKKIICPCLNEYKKEVESIENEHKRTCECCRKILEKLHLVTSGGKDKASFCSSFLDIFKSSCFGGKCVCCQKVMGKIKTICTSTIGKCGMCKKLTGKLFKKEGAAGEEGMFDEQYENSDYDWWTKYYSSLEPDPKPNERVSIRMKYRLKIYPRELEAMQEFQGFRDVLSSFPMLKGKRTGDEILDKEMVHGIFKGGIKIYRWPPPKTSKYVTKYGHPLDDGYFSQYPSNNETHFFLRVYCVRAMQLPPKDLNGKCDPYLVIRLNEKIVNDKDNAIPKEANPFFGKRFEFNGLFPQDHTLIVQVWDRDTVSGDDLIGETSIDIENRLYTDYRANCGLPEHYEESGYCEWRDQLKPVNILGKICTHYNLPKPVYGPTSVKVCSTVFESPHYETSGNENVDKQRKALYALRNWHKVPYVGHRLVPEHIETRSLYHPKRALVEQGKLQLWIDLFFSRALPPPKPVDISIKPAKQYELRVIIWNTTDVLLQEDDFFTGQKKSDIFVKGFLLGHDNIQSTDVHYRSLSGEGNFNWRFIFPMEYMMNEDKTVIYKTGGLINSKQCDKKFPCRLTLQVWENDTFSEDDFLGTLTLDLSHLPRGAKDSKQCSLAIIEPNVPHINLFRKKRTKGWWPFKGNDLDGNLTLVGKVEAELEIVSEEEAKANPAGIGRSEPQALKAPKRPETSFSWFLNPFKSFKHVVCKLYLWKIIRCGLCLLIFIFFGLAIYAFPGYMVKKLLGV